MKWYVTLSNNDEGVKWLEIESDETDTKGYFLYSYIKEDFAYDSWFQSLEEAFSAATDRYGVVKENWKVLSEN
ncbi:MAG: hypothetical protein ABIP80_01795 [Ferruginibacter sp.]